MRYVSRSGTEQPLKAPAACRGGPGEPLAGHLAVAARETGRGRIDISDLIHPPLVILRTVSHDCSNPSYSVYRIISNGMPRQG